MQDVPHIADRDAGLAEAAHAGKPYRTPLDPLPGAPGASHGVFVSDGTPKDYAEALRMGLLFTLIRRNGDAGISQGMLSRALLWLEDAKHAATWLRGTALADFERVRESDPLSTAMYLFMKEPVKRLLVVADDDPRRPVGWVTPFEILPHMADSFDGSAAEEPKPLATQPVPAAS